MNNWQYAYAARLLQKGRDAICYEDLANKFNIEIPKEVIKNVAYIVLEKDDGNIGYYGTARLHDYERERIKNFYMQLKNEINKG